MRLLMVHKKKHVGISVIYQINHTIGKRESRLSLQSSSLTNEATKRCLAYESSAGVITPAYAKRNGKSTE
jgi:hypothetical protein